MKTADVLQLLAVAEKLKCHTRHSDTSTGRRESVAEHSWRLCFFAMLMEDAFPEADMDRVIRMCVVHDLGEAFTGDIPTFEKTEAHQKEEAAAFDAFVARLPVPFRDSMRELLAEMEAKETLEAKIYKALDKLEAIIQHNEADIASWLPLEYELQQTYAVEVTAFSPVFEELREASKQITLEKIEAEARRRGMRGEELALAMRAAAAAEKVESEDASTKGEI